MVEQFLWRLHYLLNNFSELTKNQTSPLLILYEAYLQYIPRNVHTVFALLCFVVVIHWLIFPNPSGLFHWHCGNLTIAPVPAKQPWWIWTNTSCEFIMNDCITTTKQSTTKPCAYFLGYTVYSPLERIVIRKAFHSRVVRGVTICVIGHETVTDDNCFRLSTSCRHLWEWYAGYCGVR